jgi:hypothetical protein
LFSVGILFPCEPALTPSFDPRVCFR